MAVQLIDFNNSFITWLTKDESFGRFNIEAGFTIQKNNSVVSYFLSSTVMACNVYGKDELFKTPNYTFSIIFSENKYKRFRFYNDTNKFNNDTGFNSAVFQSVNISANYCKYKKLNNVTDIAQASQANNELIAVINKEETTITFPVKHINFNKSLCNFQVEMGYLMHNKNDHTDINDLELFYIAFNSFDKYELLAYGNNNSVKIHKGEISVYAKI